MAIDISGSMTDSIGDVKAAVKQFLGALRDEDTVMVLAFNNSVFTVARPEVTREARLRAVDRLAPWGGTALYDAVIQSVDLVSHKSGRKAVVVFTDGDDQDSRVNEDALERRLKTNDAVVYTVGQGRGVKDQDFKRRLEAMATTSGGRGFFVHGRKELNEAFQSIVEEISHQYVLGYTPTNAARDGSWRRLEVGVADTHDWLRYRQGYLAAPEGKR